MQRHALWFESVRSYLERGKARRSVSRRTRKRFDQRLQQTEKLEERTLLTGGGGFGYGLSVGDATVQEGDAAQVQVGLNIASANAITVDWVAHSNFHHVGNAATRYHDYCGGVWIHNPCHGTLTIPAFTTSATISVATDLDSLVESDEFFWVELNNPSPGVTINDGVGVVTITENSGGGGGSGPFLNFASDTAVFEADGTATLTVTLSEPQPSDVTFEWDAFDGTATRANSDFDEPVGPETRTIPAGQTSIDISVPIVDDIIGEPDEVFTVELSNPSGAEIGDGIGSITILNDDAAVPQISITDASHVEDTLPNQVTLAVTLSQPTSAQVSVDFETIDVTATGDVDFGSQQLQTLTFFPNQLTRYITVGITADTEMEADETFEVFLSNPVNATIADNTGVVTIEDDDDDAPLPQVSVSDGSGSEPSNPGVVTISISSVPDSIVTVDYSTQDGSAVAGSDYVSQGGTIEFYPGGPLSHEISIPVLDDAQLESTETLNVLLSDVSTNAEILDGLHRWRRR